MYGLVFFTGPARPIQSINPYGLVIFMGPLKLPIHKSAWIGILFRPIKTTNPNGFMDWNFCRDPWKLPIQTDLWIGIFVGTHKNYQSIMIYGLDWLVATLKIPIQIRFFFGGGGSFFAPFFSFRFFLLFLGGGVVLIFSPFFFLGSQIPF